jgi:hypothetical protein
MSCISPVSFNITPIVKNKKKVLRSCSTVDLRKMNRNFSDFVSEINETIFVAPYAMEPDAKRKTKVSSR